MAIRRGDELMALEGAEEGSLKVIKKYGGRLCLGMAVLTPQCVAVVVVVIIVIIVIFNN